MIGISAVRRWRCCFRSPRSAVLRPRPTCASAWATIPTCSIRRCRAPIPRRIVFASLCDKLFDIDEKLEHRAAAGARPRDLGRRQDRHHQAPPRREVPRRRAVRRRGRQVQPRPPPHHEGLVPQARARRRSTRVEVVDPLTIKLNLKQPFSPLLAQLTDRAGMMVSPKAAEAAGDKFGLKPVCAGPYKFVERVQQDRIVVEKFADYWNKDQVFIDKITYLPIVDGTVRLANLRSGGLDLIERVLATDIKTVRDDPKLKLSKAVSLGWFGLLINVANGPKADNPLGKDARVRQAFELCDRPRGAEPGRVQRRVRAGQPVGQPAEPVLPAGLPDPQARRRQGQGADEGSRRHRPAPDRLHGRQQRRRRAPSPRSCSRWRPRPASTSRSASPRSRPRSSRPRTATSSSTMNTWSGRIDPDGNSVIYQTCGAPLNIGHYCDKEVDAWHQEARAASDLADAQGGLREDHRQVPAPTARSSTSTIRNS